MSANGSRKASNASSASKPGPLTSSIYDNVFSEKDKKPLKVKVRKPQVKQSNPGNWKENEIQKIGPNADEPHSDSDSPLVNQLDDHILAGFPTGRPMQDKPDLVQCKHCKKPVLKLAAAAHIKDCLSKKQEKLKKKKEAKEAKDAAARREKGEKGGDDDDDLSQNKGARKSAIKGADGEDGPKKGKKRKADTDAGKEPKSKKKKDEPKAKPTKQKGPVDVERQCGVPLPNGGQCARSLTCKSHSMGLKRAVPGRSLPYDVLLAQYQKKNQAKQQRAAIEANAPLIDEDSHGPIDSDEEKEAVMTAIARSRPQPLVTRTYLATGSKYRYVRMKEMLRNALGGSRGAGLFSTTAPLGSMMGLPGQMGPPEGLSKIDTNVARHAMMGSSLASAGLGSATGDGLFGSPMNSAALDGTFETHSRRASGVVSTPRQILPGQLPPPRKPSITG